MRMFKFLSSAYKQKKVFFPILLFLVLTTGILLPRITLADTSSWLGLPSFADLIVSVSNFFSWIAYYIADYSGKLFSAVLSTIQDNKWAITRDKVVITGGILNQNTMVVQAGTFTVPTVAGSVFLAAWNIVKNWANMLIALGVIGVAIATILRFRDYEAKKLLLPLIIVALLVNFSVVFVGLMIDVSNVVITRVLGQNASGTNDMILIINGAWNNTALKLPVVTTHEAFIYAGINNLFTVMYFIVGLVLLIFSLILIGRYVMLAFLFILSPLAFVFFVFPFPDAKKLWTSWWHHFIKWCFVGVGAGFTITLAMDMLKTFSASNRFSVATSTSTTPDLSGLILSLAIVILFLIIGLYMTIKSAGPAANMVMGAAKTGLAFATGAVVGGALKATGVSGTAKRAKEAISDRATRIAEAIPGVNKFVPRGTANLRAQARLEKDNAAKETAAATPEQREKTAFDPAFTETTKNRKVEAIRQMAEKGELKNIKDADRRKQLMEYGTYHGLSADLFIKGDPDLAENDEKGIKELIRTGKATGANEIEKRTSAIGMLRRKAYSSMDTKDINEMQEQDYLILAEEKSARGAKALERAVKEKKLDKVHGGDLDLIHEGMQNAEQYGSSVRKPANKLDPRLIEKDISARDKRIEEERLRGRIITPAMAIDQLKAEQYQKLNVVDIKDMETRAFTIEFAENTTAKKIGEAGKDLSKEQIRKLKDLLPTIAIKGRAARGAGRNAEADDWAAKYSEIDALS